MSNFIYYGHFYQLCIGSCQYPCRSTLEIIRSCNQELVREVSQSPRVLLDRRPDAVFIMLNPGDSRPCNGQEPSDNISPCQIEDHARCNLALAYPDDTQKAIEIVMTCKNLDHVRVLNLFDIRESCSKMLVNQIKDSLGLVEHRERIPNRPCILSYSIFSPGREGELISRLSIGNHRRVIAAWGAERALIPFFELFYRMLEGEDINVQIYGWQLKAFYHPSRRKQKWAQHIVDNWDASHQSRNADS